jgi:K+-sensing histidine kinase KdpD
MTMSEEPKFCGSSATSADEAPSQALLPIAVPTLLLVCASGPELDAVCSSFLACGIRPVHVPRVELCPPPEVAPPHVFVELGLPGAKSYLEAIAHRSDLVFPVAILSRDEDPTVAHRCGALSTLERPLLPNLCVDIVLGQRRRLLAHQHSEVIVGHDQRVSTTNAFEGLLRAVGQDVRTPLATALANVEYLHELLRSEDSPLSPDEHEAVLGDTLAALQQIRAVLENVNALVPKDPPELNRIRLWAVAQRVIDELPATRNRVTLVGDAEVRGFGDEATLFEVVRTLLRRALERHAGQTQGDVTLHVYAHDTEARLTVRDHAASLSEPPHGDPFSPGLTLGKPGQSGLLLTAARHAIVRMGGSLTYVGRSQSGSAFRVRLRIAPALSS